MKKRFVAGWLILVLAGCGGGGGEPAPSTSTVTITTQALNQGNLGHSYFQRMTAFGGAGGYTWWVSTAGDSLPNGMSMQPDGTLAGSPTQAVTASVVVVCQDADSALDLVTLDLEVRDVEISGGTTQNLATGQQLQLQAQGGSPGYAFSFTTNGSGAALSAGGDYTAGANAAIDVVRATDNDGFYEELSLTVGSNPFVGFKAVWGTTDVWFISFDVVYDPNPTYASDFDATLVSLGLRDAASTDAVGTEADNLARLLVMRRVLGRISSYFGNSMDGALLPGGLAISFPAPVAPAGSTPPVGGIGAPGGTAYNTMCVRWGPNTQVVGTAWLDPGNDSLEHDCGTPSGTPLGVFSNRVLNPYLQSFGSLSVPVGSADVAGMTAMLNGSTPQNAREQAIFNTTDGFGRVLGAVLAHEIGHSLGLNHSGSSGAPSSSGQSDIMNSALTVSPSVSYAFNSGHWAKLLNSLPGVNR